jgi:hypothetical protein
MCELCGDADGAIFLRARCHMTAPLMARKEGEWLILSCYVPSCGREVARLKLADSLTIYRETYAKGLLEQ